MALKFKLLLISLFTIASVTVMTSCKSKNEAVKEETEIKEDVQAAVVSDETEEAVGEKKPEVYKVKIYTDHGDMVVKLYNKTPLHRDNFVKLVKQGYYDSLIFHRVIQNFMIQGGDPDSKAAAPNMAYGAGGPGYRVPAEFFPDLIHKKGALAAARDNNPQKASSGSQFYIVQGNIYSLEQLNQMQMQYGINFSNKQKTLYSTVGGTPHLDGNYTVFGEVIEGLDVIDKIAAQPTNKALGDRPVKDVRMRMEIVE